MKLKRAKMSHRLLQECPEANMASNEQSSEILESDEKDLAILCYLGTQVFTYENQRQWWLANSEFTEHDLDLILNMSGLFAPALQSDKSRAHVKCYSSNSIRQIDGLDSPATYSGIRDLVKKIRDSTAFWESRILFGSMSSPIANAVLESDEKDPFTLFYLGRRVFQKTPENEIQRQWWLANSEFTEDDLDLVSRMADLFQPLDASNSDGSYRVHKHLYLANSDDQIGGADSPVTYSGLRDLVKRIRASAAFRESLGHIC